MSAQTPLVVHVSRIQLEGLEIDTLLDPGVVHVEGEEDFALASGHLKVRLDKGDDGGVHVRGRLDARLRMQCGRCLEPFDLPVDQEVDLFYLPRHRENQAEEQDAGVALSDHEMVVAYYENDRFDLGDTVREQLFLGIPMRRRCREDCKGLCPTCGIDRNAGTCDCPPAEPADTPLLSLGALFDKGSLN